MVIDGMKRRKECAAKRGVGQIQFKLCWPPEVLDVIIGAFDCSDKKRGFQIFDVSFKRVLVNAPGRGTEWFERKFLTGIVGYGRKDP
jgi:hypothetical protein